MQVEKIILQSEWGRDISHKHIKNDNPSVAVFFPGQNYSCELPLLYYTGKSAYDAGHDLLMLEYGYQSARTAFEEAKVDQLIHECYTSINQIINDKERSIRHVFLTPIRSTIPIIEKFGGLVVSGTKDPVFHEDDIEHIEGFPNTEVLRIKDANHILEVSDLHQSLKILKNLVKVSSGFFNHK